MFLTVIWLQPTVTHKAPKTWRLETMLQLCNKSKGHRRVTQLHWDPCMWEYHVSAESPRWTRNISHSSEKRFSKGTGKKKKITLDLMQNSPLQLQREMVFYLLWDDVMALILLDCCISYWKLGASVDQIENTSIVSRRPTNGVKIICWTVVAFLTTQP